MKLILQKNYFKLLIAFVVMLTFSDVKAQVYFDLSTGNYSESFTSWTTPTTGTNWSSVAILPTGTIPVATRTTVASTVFTATTAGGVQNGATNIQFLSTGATANTNAVALDLNLNFTGRNAGNFSLDVATVFNGTGNRVASLKVYYSIDGTTWTELTGTNLPYVATNTVVGSGSVSLALPAALNNQPTVKLRFYNYNGTANGTTGSRPKISIDNVAITSTAGAATPTVTTLSASSITTTSANLNGTINANTTTTIASFDYGTTVAYGNSISASPSSITGTTPTPITTNLFSLNVNTLYNFRAVGAEATLFNGANATFYTLANVPNAVLVDNPQLTTLNVTVDAVSQNSNPAITQYAIQEIGGNYVQANGSLGATAVWQTASVWGTKTVTGLNNNTSYTFRVKARNGSNVETAFGLNAQGTTLQNLSASVTVNALLNSFGNLCIGTSAESSFTFDGANLNGTNLVINPVDGFTYSLNQFSYTATLNIAFVGSTITAQQVWVRFSPTSVQSYNDFILISGGGLSTNVLVATSGSGVNTPVVVNSGSASLITSSTATLSTTLVLGCSSVTSYGFEYSTTNNFANGTGTSVSSSNIASNSFSSNIAGLNPSTTYYFKGFALDATGTIRSVQASFVTSAIPAPVANTANSITNTQFDANWSVVTQATDYRLDVSKFPTFTSTSPATDLFFSEYIEGSSNNKYVEIYNGTGASVNLSNYELRLFTNGATVATNAQVLSGTLANGATIVYKNSLSTIYGGATTNGTAVNYNGDDALGLWKVSTSSFVDIFGRIGEDPGTAWTSPGFSTLDKTLVRNPNITSGVTVNPTTGFPTLATQWTQFNIDTISNLGSHTFNSIAPSFVLGYENLLVSGTSQLVTGLTENTNYYYRVRAQNASSTSLNSNVINVLTAVTNPTFTSVSQASGIVCDGSLATFNVIGLVPNSTSTITYDINGGSTLTFTNLVSNNSGNASFTSVLNASNNGQTLTVLTVERTDLIASSILNLSSSNTVSLSVSPNVTYYVDADNDGFGDASISVSNCIQPIGYVLNNTDCNDNNASIYQSATLFIDVDADNYNNGTQIVCYGATVPT
uniref:beta strand repeat-containing protein n=1 Tax=Flavobacterium sp. TaxID=239 RepID=UPI00375357B6